MKMLPPPLPTRSLVVLCTGERLGGARRSLEHLIAATDKANVRLFAMRAIADDALLASSCAPDVADAPLDALIEGSELPEFDAASVVLDRLVVFDVNANGCTHTAHIHCNCDVADAITIAEQEQQITTLGRYRFKQLRCIEGARARDSQTQPLSPAFFEALFDDNATTVAILELQNHMPARTSLFSPLDRRHALRRVRPARAPALAAAVAAFPRERRYVAVHLRFGSYARAEAAGGAAALDACARCFQEVLAAAADDVAEPVAMLSDARLDGERTRDTTARGSRSQKLTEQWASVTQRDAFGTYVRRLQRRVGAIGALGAANFSVGHRYLVDYYIARRARVLITHDDTFAASVMDADGFEPRPPPSIIRCC